MLVFEFFSGIRIFTGLSEMKRSTCFYMIFIHLFSSCTSKWLMFAIGIDRLLAILKPINYKCWNNSIYSVIISIPGLLFALIIISIQFIFVNDKQINICNPLSAMNIEIKNIYLCIILGICLSTIIVYSLTFLFLSKIGKKNLKNDHLLLTVHKEMAITLGINTFFFVLSTTMGYIITGIVQMFSISNVIKESFDALVVIPILLSSSCTFYLLYWRAHLYKKAFKKQLISINCFSNKRKKQIKSSHIKLTQIKNIG
ncbi:GPCR, rhodopsin-like, 7TM domain and 7TM GPCR, olfactory receptor/chemoreceptor Srsx family-containing protein [Strongyloides ratti]|uniref:GPCR, rhodopsin-like, 7TM domain and 7TM GPCR, olfactory receptor/chemoreceptor Srsx family-containing protein n=1 Tax=Strongyloides ratti TaxID=34506 RepID=A0A090MZV4_STRRB|nr:GPCR, rhodopsin-like, 7TM domain and 7TM GPCR, olfactory receptor/chemoreceptor Srsx family-containing protein [Strongyloides ratti]CEF69590.1 GPCR, rhodopsin-like, 7TM domain and 7TM GPCR, olfactory receptor/chemoreceptor Srsx family-containing protein [Strongyloides ratti]